MRDSRLWRFPLAGSSPRLGHRSYHTTSEEPPLSSANSYSDISSSDVRYSVATPAYVEASSGFLARP